MTGNYLESQITFNIIGPIVAFRAYIFRDVLPAFGNLGERAEQAANDYYDRVGSQPVGEYGELDIADVAETAHDRSVSWYEMMTSLQQTMLNLLAAGLFHLAEQQLGALSRDVSFSERPLRDTKLAVVADWYFTHLQLDLKTLPSWAIMDELRLVANAVKHAEGAATTQLRTLRPELFRNPAFVEIDREFAQRGMALGTSAVSAPLSGEDFFVTEQLLQGYAEGAESLFGEIAAYFKAHGRNHY